MNVKYSSVITLVCVFSLSVVTDKSIAAVSKMQIKAWGSLGVYSDAEILWVDADMHGRFQRDDGSMGQYQVPVTLYYPKNTSPKAGVIEWLNPTQFNVSREGEPPDGKRSIIRHAERIFGDLLWRSHYSFMNLQWSKMVVDELGPQFGFIERGTDAYQIMQDAADYLRNPASDGGLVFETLQPVEHVVSVGFSSPAWIQWHFVDDGHNVKNSGSLHYDGFLALTAVPGGIFCDTLTDDTTPRNHPVLPQIATYIAEGQCGDEHKLKPASKYIAVLSETEVAWRDGYLNRADTDNYRQYELAGIAHLARGTLDARKYGVKNQNPANPFPVYKAALVNLVNWIVEGINPPKSTYLDGELQSDGIFAYQRDKHGNVLGGIRLPHMASVTDDGELIGAPLGVYSGWDPEAKGWGDLEEGDYAMWVLARMLSGTFKPFDRETLDKLYPHREEFERRIKSAADNLLAHGFILEEDHRSYYRSAKYQLPALE